MPQFFGKKRYKFDIPLAKRLMTDLNAALLEQFLNITRVEGEAVVEPEGYWMMLSGNRWR